MIEKMLLLRHKIFLPTVVTTSAHYWFWGPSQVFVMLSFFSHQLFLPSMRKKSGLSSTEGSVDGDTLTAHWFVDDMYTFENVGFTKDVGNIKYLICADCEIGPIGWHCLDDKKSFYVAVERVNHA